MRFEGMGPADGETGSPGPRRWRSRLLPADAGIRRFAIRRCYIPPSLLRLKPWWAIAFAFVVTLALELALVERKYGLFAGGFGASHVVDRPAEAGLFLFALLPAHALLIGLLYLFIRALHGKRRDSPVFLLNFLFFAVGGFAAALIAKFEALSYFSDALGFELIRSLGGGSLADAALFVASDAALAILAAAGAVTGWWLALRLGRRFLPALARAALASAALRGRERARRPLCARPLHRSGSGAPGAGRSERLRPRRLWLVHAAARPGAVRRFAPPVRARRAR